MSVCAGVILCAIACMGAVSELPPAAPSADPWSWYAVLTNGTAQGVTSLVLILAIGAIVWLNRKLHSVYDAWHSDDEGRSDRMQEALVKNADANARLSMSLSSLEETSKEVARIVAGCPKR
jgi:hypothetical protein